MCTSLLVTNSGCSHGRESYRVGEAHDLDVFDMQAATGEEADAVMPVLAHRSSSVADYHHVGGRRPLTVMPLVPAARMPPPAAPPAEMVIDLVIARRQTTRIKRVDDTAGSGLGDGAGKRLARCRAAARIGVVTDTRDQGTGRLSEAPTL